MITYSTCRDCGGLLHITDPDDTVHPLCAPKPTKAERLTLEWLAAVEAGDDEHADQLQIQIEDLDNRPPRLLAAALRYAKWGWPVFPLKPRAKQPATPNGFKDATTDPDRIRRWWERHPDSNIGLPTGHAFDVIDIDVPDGPMSFAHLVDDDAVPDVHGQVATASGGLHLYIPATGEGNRAGIEPGIDYRGAGGYVVAPPSTLGERGRSWSWITVPSPQLTQTREAVAR
ncbi:bifunctional DNA primase/polymerase [Mycolicibacterium litorale]|uniref:bifunctional DNA primase/polymerase n=1 Tax=Mycolicibacterium litorale TaxID=758802 RepID=UPI003CEF2EDC